jgi:hypothetical protein
MTDKDTSPRGLTLQELALLELEAALEKHRREQGESAPSGDGGSRRRVWGLRQPGWRLPFNPWFMFDRRHPVIRRITVIALAAVAVVVLAVGALIWRLSSGPIMLDVATPWLTSAIEKNFGNKYRVEVGGTQLERIRRAARRCGCVTSSCTIGRAAQRSRPRRKRRSGSPAPVFLWRTPGRRASVSSMQP